MQAGDDPAERRGNDDGRGHLPAGGAQDARVGDQIAVRLAHALKRVAKDHEEHHNHRQGHLGCHAETKGNDEDRTEHDTRYGIGDLDVDAEDVGQQPVATESDATEYAQHGANEKAQHRLLQRHQDLLPERPLRGAFGQPGPDLLADQRGHGKEEGVDPFEAPRQFPAAEHRHQQADPQQIDQKPMAAQPRLAGERLGAFRHPAGAVVLDRWIDRGVDHGLLSVDVGFLARS